MTVCNDSTVNKWFISRFLRTSAVKSPLLLTQLKLKAERNLKILGKKFRSWIHKLMNSFLMFAKSKINFWQIFLHKLISYLLNISQQTGFIWLDINLAHSVCVSFYNHRNDQLLAFVYSAISRPLSWSLAIRVFSNAVGFDFGKAIQTLNNSWRTRMTSVHALSIDMQTNAKFVFELLACSFQFSKDSSVAKQEHPYN